MGVLGLIASEKSRMPLRLPGDSAFNFLAVDIWLMTLFFHDHANFFRILAYVKIKIGRRRYFFENSQEVTI